SADLSISKTDGVTSVTAGDGVTHTYTITVHNSGPSDAQSVSVADAFPSGFSEGTATPSVGSFSNNTWTVGTLASGASATLTINYTVPSSTTASQTNTATVSSSTSDPNTNNNCSPTRRSSDLSADLSISKTDG